MEESELAIDTPVGLLPDLAEWGIEPVDSGICEDTYDNRRILREQKCRWTPVYRSNGESTNLILAITSEMRTAALLSNKASILSKPNDPESDYRTGFALLIEPSAPNLVPAWVLSATRHWEEVADERDRRKEEHNPKPYRPALIGPPARCLATTLSGKRCANWANGTVDMNGLCKMHLANRSHDSEEVGINTLAKARNRLISAAQGAVDGLEELSQTATSEPVRLGAYNSLLDRAGIRGGVEIDTTVRLDTRSHADEVRARLEALRAGATVRAELEEARLTRDTETDSRGELVTLSPEDWQVSNEKIIKDTEEKNRERHS